MAVTETSTAYRAGTTAGQAFSVLGAPFGLVLVLTGSTVVGASIVVAASALTAAQAYRRRTARNAETFS